MSLAQRLRQAAKLNRRVLAIERVFASRIEAEMDRAARQMGEDFGNGGLERAIVGLEVHRENLRAILEDLYAMAGDSALKLLLDETQKAHVAIIETKGDMAEALRRLATSWATLAFEKVVGITNTTIEMLRLTTINAVREGVHEREMGKIIQEAMGSTSKWRGRMIARTESHASVMESQHELVKDMELPEYRREWLSGRDGRTRKSHRKANGQRVGPDEPFDVGGEKLMYPGDRSGKPENVINCRCSVVRVFDDDL